jgi:ligand-binding sensor domain-containing protein
LLAGTSHGIFVWQDGRWQPAGHVVQMEEKTTYVRRKGKRVKTTETVAKPAGEIDGRVNELDLTRSTWYAATSAGIFQSVDQGRVWTGGPVLGETNYSSVHSMGPVVLATRRTGIAVSQDGGKNWQPESLPGKLTSIRTSTIAPGGSMWVGGREGVYFSTDSGANWTSMSTLPISDINSIEYDSDLKRLVITSWSSTWVMAVNETDKSWKWWDAGWHVRGVRSNDGRLLAASLYNGVVVQPQDSAAKQVAAVAKQGIGAAR